MTRHTGARRRRYAHAGRQHEMREQQRRGRYAGAATTFAIPAPDGAVRCPQDPAHGPLSRWSGSGAYDAYCTDGGHQGLPFYRLVDGQAVKP